MKVSKVKHMYEKLMDNKNNIEESARELWKGHGADIGKLNGYLHEVSSIILNMAESLNEEDKLVTINYIKNALSDFKSACDRRDEYMLADCLYFEWRELVSIYIDEAEE